MVTGKTSSGFEFRIPDGIKSDYRFVRAYKKLFSPDEQTQMDGVFELPGAVLCDTAEEERFLRHLAGADGRADIRRVLHELREIIEIASREDATIKKS